MKSVGGTFSIDPSYDPISLPNDEQEDSSPSLAKDVSSNEDVVVPSLGEREVATPLCHTSIHSVHEELDDVEPELHLTFEEEPTSFVEANEEEVWRKAMIEELDGIENNKTWELVPRPTGVKPIGLK